MKLPQLQSLLPGRGMMFVALGLSLAIGWYFYNASGVADHLTKRNFNYLNQIGSNIDASVDAAGQYGKFVTPNAIAAGIYEGYVTKFEENRSRYVGQTKKKRASPLAIRKPSAKRILSHSVRDVFEGMQSRLVRDGHLVSDVKNLAIEISEEEMKPLSGKGSLRSSGSPGDLIEKTRRRLASQDAAWIKLPVNICRDEACEKKKASCLTITKPDYAPTELVPTGFKTTFSVLLGIPEVDLSQCQASEELPSRYLRAKFSLTIPFTDIKGVGNSETAFDTVLLAKSEGRPDGSALIFSNVDEQVYSGDLFHLLNVSSRFERFSSIRDFESRNRPFQNGPLHAESVQESNDTLRAFTQSTVIPIQVGGFSKLAFVQPFTSAHLPEEDKLVLIGIVSESIFNKSKYAVPYNWLSNALLLLLLGVLSLNFARLKLIKNKGILRRSDVYISIFSLAGVASLFVVFLIQVIASWGFNTSFDEDAKSIHARLSAQFSNELEAKIRQVNDIHYREFPKNNCSKRSEADTSDCYVGKNDGVSNDELVGSCSNKNMVLKSGTSGFPEVTTQFALDQNGEQNCYYFTNNRSGGRLKFNVESREYFRKIRGGEGWRTNRKSWSAELQESWGKLFQGEFYLNRIESKTDGAQQTAISFPFGDGVLVALAKFYSLENTVLPPGHGFAVFSNETGLVLFHSNNSRNLRENFYRATDDNEELKSTVLSRSKRKVSLTYKGDLVDATVSPLKNTQWTLVTFYRNSIIDAFNFHLGTSALILGGVYGAVFLVVLPGLILLLRWLFRMAFSIRVEERFRHHELPQWIFPERGKSAAQRSLGAALLYLLVGYIACIYFLDLPEARLWIMIVVVSVPSCWFYFLYMKPDSEEKAPIGTPAFKGKEHRVENERNNGIVRAFGLYRFNITLSILLLAVLPTLLLSNENNDIHQRQWLQFSHWFNVEKLKQRSAAHMQLNAKYELYENLCSEAVVCDRAWRGIYLPGTNLWGADLASSVFKPVANGSSLLISQTLENPSRIGWKRALGVQPGRDDQGQDQNEYLDSILSMLPSFGVEGEILEGLDVSRTSYHRGSSKLQIALADPVSGLSYTSISDFPQTRPRDPVGIALWVIFYGCMVSVSTVLIASLVGFLVRRFLSRSFEEGLAGIATIPIARDLIDGAIVIRPSDVEVDDAYQTVLGILGLEANDFDVVAGADTPENHVVVTEKSAKLIIIRDFFSVTQDHTISSEALTLVRQRLREGYSLIMLSDIDPNHWAKSDQVTEEAFELWEGIINSLSTFMLPILGEGRSLHNRRYMLSPRVYKSVWRRCSEDEQMVLAGLCHEGIVNPQNEFTLRSLYRRRLVNFQNSHFEFGDMDWREYVAESLNREDFRARARRYKNSVWISFRGPMILILLVLVMFIAYVAQDEMRLLFSLIASIGAGAGALSALGGRLSSMATKTASE